jgi:GTPase
MPSCGFIGIIGRPNVGKSTLLNSLIEKKLSITAAKVQTTRDNIIGIDTQENCQYVYIDTPGIHLSKTSSFNQILNRSAMSILQDVDCLLFLLQAARVTDEDEKLISLLRKIKTPILLLITKIDLLKNKNDILEQIDLLKKKIDWSCIIPISALKNINIKELKKSIRPLLPKQDFIYEKETLTDRSTDFILSEMIREQLTRLTDKELPYKVAVKIESFIEKNNIVKISAVILVKKKQHKIIIIGRNGNKIKQISTSSRCVMERFFNKKVFLRVWVSKKDNLFGDTFKDI